MLKILLRKELLLMRRNPFVLRVIVMMPLMVMLVMPLVANMDVKNISVAVVDDDGSLLSRRMIADMNASEYLAVAAVCDSRSHAMEMVERGEADVLLTIPTGYERNLLTPHTENVHISANGVNATKGMLGARYVAESVALTLRQEQAHMGIDGSAKSMDILNMYNPTLNFRNYMIPGLMVMLIIIICGILPAINIVSEKEKGTLDAMNVTPVGRHAFVLSKLIPYWVAAMVVVTIAMLIGWGVYGLAPSGSVLGIYLAALIFSVAMSAIGVVVANSSATLLQSIFVMFALMMIFQLMGGLFTPIRSMPHWAQCVTAFVPPRYFIEIARAIYLKGTSVVELWYEYAALASFAAVFCILAAITYRKRT